MKKYKELTGNIKMTKTNLLVGEPMEYDGAEIDDPILEIGDYFYNSNLDQWSIEKKYFQSKQHTHPQHSRNMIITSTITKGEITQVEIDAALGIVEPKTKNKPWKI